MKQWWCWWLLLLPAAAVAAPGEVSIVDLKADEPGAAFDNERYQLGYQVYMARGNLAAAFQVARKAVRALPNDVSWLKRYAQAAEWVGQPAEALQAWLGLARKTGDKEAWAAVARLAPGLLNDEALLAYQQHLLQSQGNKEELINQIVQTYERLGRVDAGMDFLRELNRRQPSRTTLAAQAGLAERAGRDDQAVSLLTELVQRYGPEEGWLLRRAALHYSRGELVPAWNELASVEKQMPKSAAGYWQTYAELSRLLNHKEEARRAYQVLASAGKAREADLVNYVALMQGQDALAAARLSEGLYRQFGQEPALMTALYLYQREGHVEAAEALLDSLSPEQQRRLEERPDFLEQRGQLHWRAKRYAAARADFERGLGVAPRNPRFLQFLVGVLMEQNDTDALQQILAGLERRARGEPPLWGLWASGWIQLEQPRRALPFQQAYSRANPDDMLGLLSLADTYANLGDNDSAGQIRSRVLGRKLPADTAERTALLRDALLALRLNQAAPEPGLAILRARLKNSKGMPDRAARDLVLGWLLSHESEDQARQWMSRAYRTDAPLWGRTSLALQAYDRVTLKELLENAERLPRYDRVEAARLIDRPALAEELAFNAAEVYQDDEQHRRFQELMSTRGHWAEFSGDSGRQGDLERDRIGLATELPLGQHWRLRFNADEIQQDSRNTASLGTPPDHVSHQALRLRRSSQQSDWTLALHHYDALADFAGASLGQDYRVDANLGLRWRLDYSAEAQESTGLLAGGLKDQFSLGFNWAFTGRAYLNLEYSGSQFHSQERNTLGQGQIINLELGARLEADSVEQALRLVGTVARFDAENGVLPKELAPLVPAQFLPEIAFFVPADYDQIGLYWTFGEAEPLLYSRAWRCFGELGVNHSSNSGAGFGYRFGLHGPVLGNDRLSLGFEQAEGGQGNGDRTQKASIAYRYFY